MAALVQLLRLWMTLGSEITTRKIRATNVQRSTRKMTKDRSNIKLFDKKISKSSKVLFYSDGLKLSNFKDFGIIYFAFSWYFFWSGPFSPVLSCGWWRRSWRQILDGLFFCLRPNFLFSNTIKQSYFKV